MLGGYRSPAADTTITMDKMIERMCAKLEPWSGTYRCYASLVRDGASSRIWADGSTATSAVERCYEAWTRMLREGWKAE